MNFTADFDAMLLRRVLNEPPMQLAKGEFGGRVGIWRLIELFDSHGVKAAIHAGPHLRTLSASSARRRAERARDRRSHVGASRAPERALEADHLGRAIAAIERLTGTRPVGTRSWHTQSLLREHGILYNSHNAPDVLPTSYP